MKLHIRFASDLKYEGTTVEVDHLEDLWSINEVDGRKIDTGEFIISSGWQDEEIDYRVVVHDDYWE